MLNLEIRNKYFNYPCYQLIFLCVISVFLQAFRGSKLAITQGIHHVHTNNATFIYFI
jgi:hypothetical protein